jgi:2-methylcitrate dehydratase PrpD
VTGSLAVRLAGWAAAAVPTRAELDLAGNALLDTISVIVAARRSGLSVGTPVLGRAGAMAALAHVLDFDDLHLPSTSHISAVCLPVALASGGDARSYLVGAGVMARLGTALGWSHYRAGWHTTCTAGAPAAAVTGAVARGLDARGIATAMALAVPAAGGVQRAFGTTAKALQVGFAADAGVRAADLAALGASADPAAVDDWFELLGGDPTALEQSLADPDVIPGGLAVKLYPCCYASQRPIAAVVQLLPIDPAKVQTIHVEAPASAFVPLIHARPATGLESKFSLEYATAATLLDGPPGLRSFADDAVARPAAKALVRRVRPSESGPGHGLLDGELRVTLELNDGTTLSSAVSRPPGWPPTVAELRRKVEDCAGPVADAVLAADWDSAWSLVTTDVPAGGRPGVR